MNDKEKQTYSIILTAYEYRVLTHNKIISLVCKKQLQAARHCDDGVELSLTLEDLEELTGYAAAESNHAHSRRQQEELGAVCDLLESHISEIKREKYM